MGYWGKQIFELSNHLGNVLATITDKKLQVSTNNSSTSYFEAEVQSVQDYYAFGMQMPGRKFNSSDYRFGFGGQMKDDEIYGSGSHYTAQFWEMDPRLGRRWNLDPKPNPSISNHAILANNPILFTDQLGDTIRWNDAKGRTLMLLDDGKNGMLTQTTKDIYGKKIQWFEPEANNYMKALYTNPDIGKIDGIKHFSWDDIVNYSDNHKSLVGYAWNGAFNDWKAHKEGADGNYLVTVEGKAYWGDAIGQIPFAINQVRANLQDGKSMDMAVKNTVERGKKFGGGLFGSADNSKSYDNFMVMRGALFAAQRFTVLKVPTTHYIEHGMKVEILDIHLKIKPASSNFMGNPIDKKTATKYGF